MLRKHAYSDNLQFVDLETNLLRNIDHHDRTLLCY